jgi:fido (protein-threonine AMPylation protein)
MVLFEVCGHNESHPLYQQFAKDNGERQYDFLHSLVGANLAAGRQFLSAHLLKVLNFQAITCLHTDAGEYRPCAVYVGDYEPPAHYLVPSYVDDLVNEVNRSWHEAEPIALGAYVLWRVNHIHPFINGNGRTARAAAHFVICLKVNGWLPGRVILPELLSMNHDEYVATLRHADASHLAGQLDLAPLIALIERLLKQQINDAGE